MTIYSAVLFIHVISGIGLFLALAAEGAIVFRIRSAQSVGETRFFIRVFQRLRIIAIPSFLGVLLGGMYLASKWGRGIFWIPLALGGTLLIMLIGGLVTGRRIARLRKVLSNTENNAPMDAVSAMAKDRALLLSFGVRVGLSLGIVFLMTAKPGLVSSIVALGVGCIVGLFVVRRMRRIANRNRKGCENWGGTVHSTALRS